MIEIGDTVKVIGKTLCGDIRKECITIGTICRVVGIDNTGESNLTVGIIPEKELPYKGFEEYWYSSDSVEKGHIEWIKENE